MSSTNSPRWYFSLRSPYSWIAGHLLRDRYPDLLARLEYRPFWEPDARSTAMLTALGGDFPYTAMSKAKHLYILRDVRRLACGLGLPLVWPVDRDPVWEIPHLAYFAAADAGRGPEFVTRASELRWEHGRNICDPATMGDLAVDLGLPPERFANAADDEDYRARGARALLDVDRDGVFGVPFFVHGREKFWGVDRLGLFATGAEAGKAPPETDVPVPASTLEGGAGPDRGHAGGCG